MATLFLRMSWHLAHSQFLLFRSILFSPKRIVLIMLRDTGTKMTVRIEMKK